MDNNNKISDIEELEGIKNSLVIHIDSSLSLWYNKVRNKKLKDLTEGDLARLIRQGMYIKYIIPESINRLSKNIVSGELYDGEVLEMLFRVDENYWSEYRQLGIKLDKILKETESKKIISKDFVWLTKEDETNFCQLVKLFREKLELILKN